MDDQEYLSKVRKFALQTAHLLRSVPAIMMMERETSTGSGILASHAATGGAGLLLYIILQMQGA